MLRPTATLIAATMLLVTPIADACYCIGVRNQAEADRLGERVWQATTLIVEGTAGPYPAMYTAACHRPGGIPQPAAVGRTVNPDRVITVHRVLKGRAPAMPILAGDDIEVLAEGCATTISTCDVRIESGRRTIFILTRVNGDRYRMATLCDVMALRQSTRGRALFGGT